jgi:hypothetical protein
MANISLPLKYIGGERPHKNIGVNDPIRTSG